MTLGGQVASAAAVVCTQAVLARILGPDGRGSLAVCVVFTTVLTLFFSVGVDTSVLYFVSSKKLTLSEGLIYTFIIGVLCSLIAMIAGWSLLHTGLSFIDKASYSDFLLALWIIPTSLFGKVYHRLLTAVELFNHFAALTLLRATLQLFLTIGFVYVAALAVKGGILVLIVTEMIVLSVCLIVFLRRFRIDLIKPSLTKLQDMFWYGAQFYLGKISTLTKDQIGTIILAFFATEAEIGWFALAARLVQQIQMIPQAITVALFPRIASDKEGKRQLVARSARVVTLVCGSIYLVIALFASPLITWVFSEKFLPAAPLLQILSVGAVAYSSAKVYLSYLVASKRPGLASIIVALGVIINITLLWYFFPKLGVVAAAWSTSANYIATSIILMFVFKHVSHLSTSEVLIFRTSDWSEFSAGYGFLQNLLRFNRRDGDGSR